MIQLGAKVQDQITGYEGIAVCRTEYLYGCVRVGVEAQTLQGGKPAETQYFDEQRLDVCSTAPTGGFGDVPPRSDIPDRR